MDILNDPRFLNCINEMDIVNHPAKLMPAYARCASVIGRPRYLHDFNFVVNFGGFQLEFVSISRVINHMTCYKSSALIG